MSSMQSFMENYDEDAFSDVYVMKDQMETFVKTRQTRAERKNFPMLFRTKGKEAMRYITVRETEFWHTTLMDMKN